jgi:hypothetical protein
MAIDTVTKRFAITNFGGDLQVLPKPDGTVGARDRLLLVSLYSGIADTEAGSGPGPAGAGIQMMLGIGI